MHELTYIEGQLDLIEKIKQELGEILDKNENKKTDMLLVDIVSMFRNLKPIEYDQSKFNSKAPDQSGTQGS